MANQYGGGQIEHTNDFDHIRAVPLDRTLVGRARAETVSPQIDCDSLVARGKMGYLRIPVAVRTGEAVHEHDRWPAITCDDVMDRWHFCLVAIVGGNIVSQRSPQ